MVALVCGLAGPFLTGQAPGTSRALTGTATIAGIVTDERNQPIRNALVRLSGSDLPDGRAVISDQRGMFAFSQLPAGRFTLTASKAAYLTTTFGAMRAGGAGTPIVVSAGQRLTSLALVMPKGGVISGTVRDSHGAPMPNLNVFAAVPGGASAPSIRPDTVTDDRGYYRIFGLRPGSYFVYVDRATSGGLGEIGAMTDADVDAALARLQARRPGTGPPPSTEPSPSSIVRPTTTFSTAPVFHPGVVSQEMAQPVQVGAGEEKSGVNISYQLSRSAAVSGTVSGAGSDQPVQLTMFAAGGTAGRAMASFGSGPMLQRRAAGDGEFSFSNVTPGRYTVHARAGLAVTGRGLVPQGGPLRYASVNVDVTGDDVNGIALVLQPAPRVTGRLRYEGGAAPAVEPGFMTVRLSASGISAPSPATAGLVPSSGAVGPVLADGTFVIEGVVPGRYSLALSPVSKDWRVKSALVGGKDALDLPFEMTGIDTSVEIVLTRSRSRLSGRLLQNDQPAPGYFVVAFPADREMWATSTRRVVSARPGTDGMFAFDDLPAGEYLLAALTDADSTSWQSPDVLATIAPLAAKVTLADGERKTQDLKIK